MGPSILYIPWFKAEPWEIPLPFDLPFGLGDTLPIQPFGLLVAIGVLLGAQIAESWGKRNGIAPWVVNDMVFHVVVGGFIGAPLLNAAAYNPDTFVQVVKDPSLLFSTCLGLSSYGGFIGAIVGLLVWKQRRKLPVRTVADAAVFALPFGWMFGRMGCYVVHDHPGQVTDFFLAVNDYRFGEPPYQPRHDLGFYEVLWSVACITLLLVLARNKRAPGFYCALVPVLYAPIRFFLDFLRADPTGGHAGDVRYLGLTPAQYASIGMLALGLYLAWYIRNHAAPALPRDAQWPPPDEEQEDEAAEGAGTKKGKNAGAKPGKGAETQSGEGKGSGGKSERSGKGKGKAKGAKAGKKPDKAPEEPSPEPDAS